MLIVVYYHYIRESYDFPYPAIFGITPQQFAQQLATLSPAGTWVSPAELLAAVRGEHRLPEKSLMVTFDDGLREQYEFAWPILNRMGIPALFFANTLPVAEGRVLGVHKIHWLRAHLSPADFLAALSRECQQRNSPLILNGDADVRATAQYRHDSPDVARLKYLLNFELDAAIRDELIEKLFAESFAGQEQAIAESLYMSAAQMAELARADALGSHTHAHLPLATLDESDVELQIVQSSDLLETWTGRRPYSISYPYGATSEQVESIAARAGNAFGFTVERAANTDLHEPLRLARFDTNDMPGGKSARWTAEELFDQAPRRTANAMRGAVL